MVSFNDGLLGLLAGIMMGYVYVGGAFTIFTTRESKYL